MTERPTPTADQLAAMTPVEIDTELSRLWNEEAQAEAKRLALVTSLHKAVGDEPRRVRGARGPIFDLSPQRVWELVTIKSRAPRVGEHGAAKEIDHTLTNWALVSRKLEDLATEIKVYTDEYVRRGCWNRAFLAKSYDGHVHNGMECSTCHHGEERTQFSWQVAYSGKDEAEIIKAAGVRACTTCYPDAPTADLKRPTVMFTEDEIEAQKAREQRAADKVKRDAVKDAKGITAPDGSPLRDDNGGRIETLVTATREAVDGLSERYKNLRVAQILEADPGLAPFFWEPEKMAQFEAKGREYAMRLVEAIAYKRDMTTAEVLAELEPKANAKAKRDSSGKDWVANMKRNASYRLELRDAYLAQCKKEGREPWEALSLRWPKV